MADYNPLDPVNQQPPPEPDQGASPGIADQWRGFLASPSNRAFLIQTGLQLFQPRPTGQSGLGAIASAVGSGGEAAGRVQAGEEHRQEAESLQDYRAASSEANLQRAAAATDRAAAAQDRAALMREKGTAPSLTQLLQTQTRAKGEFHKWLGKEDLLGSDPYSEALGVKSKAEALKRYEAEPEFKRRVLDLFGVEGAPAGIPMPQDTRTVNGQTYFKQNGNWYKQ